MFEPQTHYNWIIVIKRQKKIDKYFFDKKKNC